MLLMLVAKSPTYCTTAKRYGRILCQSSKSSREGTKLGVDKPSETKIPRYRCKPGHLRYFVLSGVVIPWIQVGTGQASDLVETAVAQGVVGMEAEALDVGAVLLGDVALLVMAPLVIYAALKMIWEEQFEESTEEENLEEESLALNAAKGESTTDRNFTSRLEDPFLRDLAIKAAQNISKAIEKAGESCLFDANLHELVVKSEGENTNKKWIRDMLSRQSTITTSEMDQMNTELMEKTEKLTDEEICALMSRKMAEKIALKEIQRLTNALAKKFVS